MDIYVWNNNDEVKKLVCSQNTSNTVNDGITTSTPYFQLWRHDSNIIEPLYVSSFTKLDGNSNPVSYNGNVNRIDGGPTSGSYTSVAFTN